MNRTELDGRLLREFISRNTMFLSLDEGQCDNIVRMLAHDGQNLYASESGQLYRRYVDEEGEHVEFTNMDDVIDLAMDQAYKEWSDSESKLKKYSFEDIDTYAKDVADSISKENTYKSLEGAFRQTTYCQTSMRNLLAECMRIAEDEREKKQEEQRKKKHEAKEKQTEEKKKKKGRRR